MIIDGGSVDGSGALSGTGVGLSVTLTLSSCPFQKIAYKSEEKKTL